jgi:hypothetical protein
MTARFPTPFGGVPSVDGGRAYRSIRTGASPSPRLWVPRTWSRHATARIHARPPSAAGNELGVPAQQRPRRHQPQLANRGRQQPAQRAEHGAVEPRPEQGVVEGDRECNSRREQSGYDQIGQGPIPATPRRSSTSALPPRCSRAGCAAHIRAGAAECDWIWTAAVCVDDSGAVARLPGRSHPDRG